MYYSIEQVYSSSECYIIIGEELDNDNRIVFQKLIINTGEIIPSGPKANECFLKTRPYCKTLREAIGVLKRIDPSVKEIETNPSLSFEVKRYKSK